MDTIKDILLTNTEEGAVEIPDGLTEYQQNRERYKAQCLKLLDWQSKQCTEHRHLVRDRESGKGHRMEIRRRRWECPRCDAELRKELEG